MAPRRHRTSDKVDDETPERDRRRVRQLSSAEDLMNIALGLISKRSYSEGELREKLSRRSANSETVKNCVERLKDYGYIDDDLYAQNYASHRVAVKPIGRARLARELARKKVSQSRINAALDSVYEDAPEEALIDRAIARRMRTHGIPGDRAAAKRMFDHLARLGFDFDLIARKLRSIQRADED